MDGETEFMQPSISEIQSDSSRALMTWDVVHHIRREKDPLKYAPSITENARGEAVEIEFKELMERGKISV